MNIKNNISTLKKIYSKLKSPYWRAKSRYIKYYDTLEINQKLILVESQHGKELNGNIFYILKYLSTNKMYNDFEIYVTACAGKIKRFEYFLQENGMDKIHVTILSSKEYFRVLSTAKFLINDNTFLPFFIKKKGQIYLNTWHGTPLKSLGKKIQNDAHNIGNTQRNFLDADFLLFPNEYTKECILRDYMLENISSGQYILSGYPRNEIFFEKNKTIFRLVQAKSKITLE